MTGAKILAVAGIASAATVMIGGAIDSSHVVGLAGAIMLAGNLLTLYAERRKRSA